MIHHHPATGQRASLAVIACLLAAVGAGCGGGSTGSGVLAPSLPPAPSPVPTPAPAPAPMPPLPTQVTIEVAALVEAGVAVAFTSSLPELPVGWVVSWDFGDGQSSQELRPHHAFASPGRYAVNIRVTDSLGQRVTGQTTVEATRDQWLHGLNCSMPGQRGWCKLPEMPFVNSPSWDGSSWNVSFFDAQRGIARDGSAWQLWATSDGGHTWARSTEPATCSAPKTLQASPGGAVYMLGCGRLWHSLDRGEHWTERSVLPDGGVLTVQDDLNLWYMINAVGYSTAPWLATLPVSCKGTLMHSSDAGASWDTMDTTFGAECLNLMAAPGGALFANGWWAGGFWRSANQGVTWSRVGPAELDANWRWLGPLPASYFLDARLGWRSDIGTRLLYRTIDGGLTWIASPWPEMPDLPSTVDVKGIRFIDPLNGWAVGGNGMVLASSDGGVTWVRQTSGTAADLFAVHAVDAQTAWISGAAGVLLATGTGGR